MGAAVVAFQTVGSWQLDRAGLDEPADASATVGVCITLDVGPTQASEGAVRMATEAGVRKTGRLNRWCAVETLAAGRR